MLLQLNDIDRTLGLHNCLYVLRQGADHVFVYPAPRSQVPTEERCTWQDSP